VGYWDEEGGLGWFFNLSRPRPCSDQRKSGPSRRGPSVSAPDSLLLCDHVTGELVVILCCLSSGQSQENLSILFYFIKELLLSD
jgi:hypothetical protein